MFRTGIPRRLLLPAVAAGLLSVAPAYPQQGTLQTAPRLEPVAETKLLMQAINVPNFQGLQQLLRQKPADAEAWTYARGQALLIAENGNLLLLRPPNNQGQDAWMNLAADLRVTATRLARAASTRDYDRCRAGLTELANACNRCHQTFRVPVRLTAFPDRPDDRLTPQPPPAAPGVPSVPKAPSVPPPPRVPDRDAR